MRRSLISAIERWRPLRHLPLAALVAVAASLYSPDLHRVPLHLGYDEVFFGLHARSLSQTGRDANGQLMPLYMQAYPSSNYWILPAAPYFSALVMRVVPFSDSAIRLPTVIVGLVNIALVYFIALRIFDRRILALVAAALLMLTPAHLIHSRLGVDYLYPLPFTLAWALCLLHFVERRQNWLLFVGTSCLGVGFYSYVASVVMMPIYLGITCLFLLVDKASWRSFASAVAGFTWPLLLLPAFLLSHPEMLGDFQARYGFRGDSFAGSPHADLRRQITGVINPRTIAERANLYHDFFSPGLFFVSGGSNVTNSTREAGVFLVPFAVFLAVGAYDAATRWTRQKALVVLGFLTAPVAALLVVENYAIDRALAFLPFGALLATLGIARMWRADCHMPLRLFSVITGTALLLAGGGYAAWRFFADSHMSATSVAVALLGVMTLGTGYMTEKTARWWPVVVYLLLLCVAQYQYFYRDYFGDYGARSAAWFGNNIRGGIERVMALDREQSAPAVYLSAGIPHVMSYWQLYSRMHGREDMLGRATLFDFERLDVDRLPRGSLLLAAAAETGAKEWVDRGTLRVVGTATDPNDRLSPMGPGEHVSFVIYRKEPPPITPGQTAISQGFDGWARRTFPIAR